eukprot:m.205780 g.205780  ORF g.205780 m.205780 type:complete len:1024 (+) comp15790_c0_seq1:494-3565(+)
MPPRKSSPRKKRRTSSSLSVGDTPPETPLSRKGESTQWMGNSLIEYVASNGERQLLDISDRINVITENSTAKDELEGESQNCNETNETVQTLETDKEAQQKKESTEGKKAEIEVEAGVKEVDDKNGRTQSLKNLSEVNGSLPFEMDKSKDDAIISDVQKLTEETCLEEDDEMMIIRGNANKNKRRRILSETDSEPSPAKHRLHFLHSKVPLDIPKPVYKNITNQEGRRKFDILSSQNYHTHERRLNESVVEYDIDDEDTAWLENINKSRKKKNLPQITDPVFEQAMDKLEKESFEMATTMDQDPAQLLYDDEAVCSICLNGDCENANVILFCDACNLPVHQDCYGVPFIPEGQWLCRRCMSVPGQSVPCVLCPNRGGAFKQTEDGRQWVHVTCALWVPEVFFGNTILKEPVSGMQDISPARYGLTCYICGKKKKGACIQCYKTKCCTAFHVTCAQQAGLCMGSWKDEGSDEITMHAYCHQHTPRWSEQKPLISTKKGELVLNKSEMAKRRAQQGGKGSESKTPTIVIPSVDPSVLHNMLGSCQVSPVVESARLLRQYWMLKRKSRHGVALLRRLQNTSLADKAAEKAEERRKFQEFRNLLEKTRMLVGQCLRRERMKAAIIAATQEMFEKQATPLKGFLSHGLDCLIKKDKHKIFAQPVDAKAIPEYLEIIKKPMDFSTMRQKIASGEYLDLKSFIDDFHLICRNAMTFNAPKTWWHDTAQDMLHSGNATLEGIAEAAVKLGIHDGSPIQQDNVQNDTINGHFHPGAGLDLVFNLDLSMVSEEELPPPCSTISEPAPNVKLSEEQLTAAKAKAEKIILQDMIGTRNYKNFASRAGTINRLSHDIFCLREGRIKDISESMRKKAGLPVLPKARKKSETSAKQKTEEPTILQKKLDQFEDGDVVWAKYKSTPWFPAKVVDPFNSKDIYPEQLLKSLPNAMKKAIQKNDSSYQRHADDPFLIQFFDVRRNWAVIVKDRLKMFGVTRKEDEKYLVKAKKTVKVAYEDARTFHEKKIYKRTTRSVAAN